MKVCARLTRHVLLAVLWLGAVTVADAGAGVTSLLLDSEPGDYVGAGQLQFFTPADGLFTAQPDVDGNGVSVAFSGAAFRFWSLHVAAPPGTPLVAARTRARPGSPSRRPGSPASTCRGTGAGAASSREPSRSGSSPTAPRVRSSPSARRSSSTASWRPRPCGGRSVTTPRSPSRSARRPRRRRSRVGS